MINTENSRLLILPLMSLENPLSIGKLVSSGWQRPIFRKSNFYLKAQISLLETNPVSCFPWSDRLVLFIFEKMLPDTRRWVTIVCQSSFQIKAELHEKDSFVPDSTNRTSAFPGDNNHASLSSKHAVCVCLFRSTASLNKTGFFLVRTVSPWRWRTWWCLVQSDTWALIRAKVQASSPTIAFPPSV